MNSPIAYLEKFSSDLELPLRKIDDRRFVLGLNTSKLFTSLLIQFETEMVIFASVVFKMPSGANFNLSRFYETLLHFNSTLPGIAISLQDDRVFLQSSIPIDVFDEKRLIEQLDLYVRFYDETYPKLLQVLQELNLNLSDRAVINAKDTAT